MSDDKWEKMEDWEIKIHRRIEELERKQNNIIPMIDQLDKGGLIEQMIKENAELKECLEIAAQRDKFLSDNDGLIIQEQKNIKEVLRELILLIEQVLCNEIEGQSFEWLQQQNRELLAKLDVRSAAHTVKTPKGFTKEEWEIVEREARKKDCNKCDLYGECDHQGAYQKDDKWCYEASGGEKAEYKSWKPPVPMYILPESYDKDEREAFGDSQPYYIKKSDREDDSPERKKQIEAMDKQMMVEVGTHILVKREDLQFMVKNISLIYGHEFEEKLKYFKEEYSI